MCMHVWAVSGARGPRCGDLGVERTLATHRVLISSMCVDNQLPPQLPAASVAPFRLSLENASPPTIRAKATPPLDVTSWESQSHSMLGPLETRPGPKANRCPSHRCADVEESKDAGVSLRR